MRARPRVALLPSSAAAADFLAFFPSVDGLVAGATWRRAPERRDGARSLVLVAILFGSDRDAARRGVEDTDDSGVDAAADAARNRGTDDHCGSKASMESPTGVLARGAVGALSAV